MSSLGPTSPHLPDPLARRDGRQQRRLVIREVRLRVDPSNAADLLRVMRDEITEFYRALPSYCRSYVYGDLSAGRMVRMSIWTSTDDLHRVQDSDLVAYVKNRYGIVVEVESDALHNLLYDG